MSKIQKSEEVTVSATTEDLTPTTETPVVPTPEVEDEFTPVGELPKADEVVPTPEVTHDVTPDVVAPNVEKAKADKAAAKTPKAEKTDLVKIKFKIEVGYKTKKYSAGDEAEFTTEELKDFMPTWYTEL